MAPMRLSEGRALDLGIDRITIERKRSRRPRSCGAIENEPCVQTLRQGTARRILEQLISESTEHPGCNPGGGRRREFGTVTDHGSSRPAHRDMEQAADGAFL